MEKDIIAHGTITAYSFKEFINAVENAKKEGWVPINNPMTSGNVYNQFVVKYREVEINNH